MKEDNNIIEEIIKIPLDMMMDILTIIVKEGLKHEVVKVMPNRSLVIMEISYDKNAPKDQKVIYNIQNILSDYQHYRSWENEEINWREN